MKRAKLDKLEKLVIFWSLTRQRSLLMLMFLAFIYLLIVTVEIPYVFISGFGYLPTELPATTRPSWTRLQSGHDLQEKQAPIRPTITVSVNSDKLGPSGSADPRRIVSGLNFQRTLRPAGSGPCGLSELHKSAAVAWQEGHKLWKDLLSGKVKVAKQEKPGNVSESCAHSISLSGSDFLVRGQVMVLPCGLTLGSHVTVVGTPRGAHAEHDPKIYLLEEGEESTMVSQFHMELQGLRAVEGEEPPRILHFNPRLKGDWSGKPVIEQNTCYRMQWGTAQRCEGWKSKAEEETVDGQLKCEKWSRDDDDGHSEESMATWWLHRLTGRAKKEPVDWPFPFSEGQLFVMTLSAGLEGYSIIVNGRHVTSFPYRTGFALEDATGLTLNGDVDVHSLFAASLPTLHPNYAPQRHLELSSRWQAPPLPDQPAGMFIGILSAGNHFAERMAARKSWMRHELIRSSKVVARFFVALHARKEVNVELKKEAEFFGDIVIVPYMDNYDLVVLKTIAICEYGARKISAKYVMKCDDDTFVRVDSVLDEAKKVPAGRSLYIGNINYYHKPLRYGKWAVTYEEWPEEEYPPYANGPGYILSMDIAQFIVSDFERLNLRLFKMEDVSVGVWVEKFNSSKPVEYVHSYKYCQFGCVEDYYTAHYQSPRQMICMWEKLQKTGRPLCCNNR